MKISELTENDVIHIRNKKEAKRIAELCEGWFNPALNEYGNIAVNRAFENYGSETCIKKNIASGYNNETYVTYGSVAFYSQNSNNIIPASKFLNQSISKKDLQEALSKVGEELSSMNERLRKLEAKSDTVTAINNVEIHFDEVTEGLPNKWVVAITDGNKPKLEKWYQESHCKENLMSGYYVSNSYFIWTGVPSDHTEITFETFKKYVLKEEVKESVGLEVGKWYKDDVRKRLFCFSGEHDWDGDPTGYGFVYQMWYNNKIGWKGVKTPATETEVFEALKAEACKQYKVGQTVFDNWSNCKITLNDLTRFDYSNGNLFVLNLNNSKTHLLGSNGQWATIIPQPEAIDFAKAGQLVKSDDVIVITDGNHTSEMFSGMRLFSHVHYSDYWDKEKFTLCTEPVTLQN